MSMKKKTALFLAAALAVSALAGCEGKGGKLDGDVLQSVTMSDEYPVKTDAKLKYWVALSTNLVDSVNSLNDTEFAKELQKQTGISVEFIHPVVGNEVEGFNLMIAGGDYPDIVETAWNTFSGGPSKAIEDGVIYPLNDIIAKASPNLKKLIDSDQNLKRNISANGNIYVYPFYRGADVLCTYYGVMARGDLLDELNMEAPETIDEWETMLRGFKGKVEVPFTADLTPTIVRDMGDLLVGAYGVGADFYIDNGKVKYGPLEPGFKEFVTKMAAWYAEGLIDSEFANYDMNRVASLVINGQVGVVPGANGSNFGTWLKPFSEKNPGAYFVPLKSAVLNKGDRPQFGQKEFRASGLGAAITSNCKNVEAAARLLDYGFSEKGGELYNFGIEGISYEMKGDVPTYTDAITNAEQISGQSMAQALSNYTRVSSSGPFVQSEDYIMQFYRNDVQKEALKVWSDTDADQHKLPGLNYSAEDSSQLSKLMNDIRTNVDETVLKMILGSTPVSEYDSFVETLKSMGVEEAIQINQKAYDAYMAQ